MCRQLYRPSRSFQYYLSVLSIISFTCAVHSIGTYPSFLFTYTSMRRDAHGISNCSIVTSRVKKPYISSTRAMENQRWPWATNWRRSQQHLQSSRKEDSDSSDHYGPKNHDDGDGSSFKRLSKLDQQRSKDGWTSTKVSLRERLSHFTWCWFECTMSTGALAVLLGIQIVEHPHDSSTIMRNMILRVLGSGFYVLQVLLFGLFCALITARFCIRPAALKASLHHPQEVRRRNRKKKREWKETFMLLRYQKFPCT